MHAGIAPGRVSIVRTAVGLVFAYIYIYILGTHRFACQPLTSRVIELAGLISV